MTRHIRWFAIFAIVGSLAPEAFGQCSWFALPGSVNFGTYSVFGGGATTMTTATVRCTALRAFTVTATTGASGTYTPRMMTGSAQYNLFTDAGLSQIWGNGTGTTTVFTGSTGFATVNFPLNIHGSVPANLDLAPGVHTDTVTATLSYRFLWSGVPTPLPGVAIPVTMNVQAECRADTFNLSFGNYNPFNATALGQSSTVNVYCTRGTTATLSLDNGANASGTQKRMRSGTNYLNYSAALTFANGTSTSSLVPLRNGVTLNGSVPAGQDAATGAYTDTLQVVVNY